MPVKVLGLIGDKTKEGRIRGICEKLKLSYKEISPADINKSVGEIIGMPLLKGANRKVAPVLYSPSDILIFNGMSEKELEAFLDNYKEAGIEPTALKGVVTPNNMTWSVYELICEYEKESNK